MVVVAPLAGLGVVALVLWVIATALAIAIIVEKIGAIFHGIPVVGSYIAGAMQAVGQGITQVAGKLESGIDHLIGAAWHLFARYLDETWHQFVANAHVLAMLAKIVGDQIYSVSGLRSLVHDLTRVWHGIEHGVKTLTREYHGIERRVKALERSIARGIGHDLRIEIKALERTVTKIDHKVIPAIRSEVATAEHDVSALEKWIADHALIIGTTALTGAVAWALSQLGLGGLRCPSFLRLLRKHACGLGTLLDDALGLLIAALALESVCEFLPLIQTAFGAIVGPMVHLLNEVPLGSCEQVPQSWSNLSVTSGPLPPAQTPGTFPP